jgi:recombination protein RecA
MDKVLEKLAGKYGNAKVFRASEAPDMRVISSGIPSLDVITGVGGWPRGTVVEIFGRESLGKSALSYYTIQEVHRTGGYAAFVNLESHMKSQIEWMQRLCPDIDNNRLLVVEPTPGQESVNLFGELLSEGIFDVVVFDSIGAMATDKELVPGEAKQAYGQSGLTTQLVKQARKFAHENDCVPIFLNQIRDHSAGTFTMEKAPGGHSKDHFATLRIHLKPGREKVDAEFEGEKIEVMKRVTAKVVKNKVGKEKRNTGWNFWTAESPDGVIGIDVIQDIIDVSLQHGLVERGGSTYRHELFPDGKLRGKDETKEWLRNNLDVVEKLRRELVMQSFNDHSQVRETLTDE